MKKILLLLFCSACFTWLQAATISKVLIDELYYNLDTSAKTAEVTYEWWSSEDNYSYLSGELIIPETVNYGNVTYKVTTVGERAFQYCESITGILNIPSSITTIGERAFEDCKTITGTLNIPSSIKTIYRSAFQGCNIETVIFNGYVSIGGEPYGGANSIANTFTGCPITTIYCFSKTPPSLEGSTMNSSTTYKYNFSNYSKINVYVPLDYYPNYIKSTSSGSYPFYKQGWSEFNLIPITTTETTSITLNKTSLTMEVGEEETLTATVEPFYTEDALSWSVWPEDVVSVEDGKVVALKPGYAVITVQSGNVSTTCNVEVVGDVQGGGSEELSGGARILFMEPGQRLDIRSYFDYNREVQPLVVLMDYYEFESSDTEVVDGVSEDGGFEAKKYGMANLKVSYISKMDNTKKVNDFIVFVCPTVTVEHGNGAIYSHHVVYNSTPALSLKAGNGYRIAGVTHDGKDIYDGIMANDGKYVPAETIKDNSVINLALEETGKGPTTGADAVLNDPNIRILVDGHTVNITGVAANTVVRMYNLGGIKLFDHVNYPNIEVIDNGIYIIEIDGQPNKYRILVR